jgi:hypothetical protein
MCVYLGSKSKTRKKVLTTKLHNVARRKEKKKKFVKSSSTLCDFGDFVVKFLVK